MTERHTPPCAQFTEAMLTEARSYKEYEALDAEQRELFSQGATFDSPKMEELRAKFEMFNREHFNTILIWHAARNCGFDSRISSGVDPSQFCPVVALKDRLGAKATAQASQP